MDQCCWNVFYLTRGPLKYQFGYQKCIYIAGLEIEISQNLYLMYGHGGHLEKWQFLRVILIIRIFGNQMTVILDFVNKSLTNVAEMYFIGFVDPENISLDTKCIFLAGLEIKIS